MRRRRKGGHLTFLHVCPGCWSLWVVYKAFCYVFWDVKAIARDFCVLAYHGSHTGLKGPAEAFGYNPAAQSGKFQRHLDNVLKLDVAEAGDSYALPLPAYDRLAISRTTEEVVCLPAHEALQAEIEENDSAKFKLRESVEGHEWSKVYHSHPVVRATPPGEPVYPCAMYVDGIEFQNRETLIGFSCIT